MTKRRHPHVDPLPLFLDNPSDQSLEKAESQVSLWHQLLEASPKTQILLLPTMPRECEPNESGESGLGRTLKNLQNANFLDHIIIGVDGTITDPDAEYGDESLFEKVCKVIEEQNLPANVHVMWNDSPEMVTYREKMAAMTPVNDFGRKDPVTGLESALKDMAKATAEPDAKADNRGLAPTQRGKGRNFWGMTGYALALLDELQIDAEDAVIAIQDTDVITDELGMITPRLLLAQCVDETNRTKFTKGNFARYGEIGDEDAKLHGRVTRLFGPSFVNSVANTLQDHPDFNNKLREVIEFMNAFDYMFSGEMAFSGDVLERIEIPNDYSMEIRILHQVHDILLEQGAVASDTTVIPRYDHHHQDAGGVEKMAAQIAAAFLDIVDGDIEVTQEIVERIQHAYEKRALSEATDLTRVFAIQSAVSGMKYDPEKERGSIDTFRNSIQTGFEEMREGLSAPSRSWQETKALRPEAGHDLMGIVKASGRIYGRDKESNEQTVEYAAQ